MYSHTCRYIYAHIQQTYIQNNVVAFVAAVNLKKKKKKKKTSGKWWPILEYELYGKLNKV